MPRNRQQVDRADKIEEILRAGERAVRAGGYEALSINAIADELGVARSAVWWYFRSKDELFAAAAGRAVQSALAHPPGRGGYAARIVWAVDQLADLRAVHTTLQDRARHDRHAKELLDAIQRQLTSQLTDVLRTSVAVERLEAVTATIFVFVQGVLALPLSAEERHRRLRFLLSEIVH